MKEVVELERSTHLSAIKKPNNNSMLCPQSPFGNFPDRRSLSAVPSGAKKGCVCLHDGVEGGRCIRRVAEGEGVSLVVRKS